MSDTIDYLNQRVKALEALVGRLSIEKDQLKELVKELCEADELPEGYKEMILKDVMILVLLTLLLLIASVVHLIVVILKKTKSELRYWIRKYLEISKLNNNKDE